MMEAIGRGTYSSVVEALLLPLVTGEKIRARIGPGCTSFASPPHFDEAIDLKNTVIDPELIAILRRELMR
jgi:hypothetical protein